MMAAAAANSASASSGHKLSSESLRVEEGHFFYEDEVYRLTSNGQIQFGMVIESAEFASSDEDEDDDEDDKKKKLTPGFVRVAWHPKGNEDVVNEKRLHLSDRSLMPGDVVRRLIRGQNTQRGYCRNIQVFANCQIVNTRQVIIGINSKDLKPLRSIAPDVVVCLDSWIGVVTDSRCKATLKFHDGSVCFMNEWELYGLEDLTDNRDYESTFDHCEYYPGQILYGPLKAFETAEWLYKSDELERNKAKRNKNYQATVIHAELIRLSVRWQCKAYSKEGDNAAAEQPGCIVSGEALKRVQKLNIFQPCTNQIGDRYFYTLKENDIIIMKEEWKRFEKNKIREENGGVLPKPKRLKKKMKKKTKSAQTKKTPAEKIMENLPKKAKESASDPKNLDTVVNHGDAASCSSSYEDLASSDSDSDSNDENDRFSTASSSNCSQAGKKGNNKKKKPPHFMTKSVLNKNRKLKRSQKCEEAAGAVTTEMNGLLGGGVGASGPPGKFSNLILAKPGDCVVVETLTTKSEVEVVWQDSTTEANISSKELFPIHHLDDQEFFCGDFVVYNQDEFNPHTYGVVQEVDHVGRTCRVKWFKTYTSSNAEAKPEFVKVSDEPVYDLKDHPDFKYRVGSIVIRVANLDEFGSSCGGRVLDLYPTGQIEVWWSDETTSYAWPQDLYKIGEYDSDDEGGLWDDDEDEDESNSDASWETESEYEELGDNLPASSLNLGVRPKLAAKIEKARIAMTRLQELFTENPTLQSGAAMKQLLDVYKNCKYLDRLMGTSFFQECHFEGLLEWVRHRGNFLRVQFDINEYMRRKFDRLPLQTSSSSVMVPGAATTTVIQSPASPPPELSSDEKQLSVNQETNTANLLLPFPPESSPLSSSICNSSSSSVLKSSAKSSFDSSSKASSIDVHTLSSVSPVSNRCDSGIEMAGSSQNPASASCSAARNQSMAPEPSSQQLEAKSLELSELLDKSTSSSATTAGLEPGSLVLNEATDQQVCARLCSLMKAQLVKAHEEVMIRYGGGTSFTEEDLKESPGEADDDLESLMHHLLSSTQEKLKSISATFESGVEESPYEEDEPDQQKINEDHSCGSDTGGIMPRGVSCQEIAKALYGVSIAEEKERNSTPNKTSGDSSELCANTSGLDVGETLPPVVPSDAAEGVFSIVENAPDSHHFKLSLFQPVKPKNFIKFLRKEVNLLKTSLPNGISVKAFEDRMDLYTVMIKGPEKTPYEDGLFFFDFQLSSDYPEAPPACHYISYCSDRLNPNLYEDGKVCVSLLGTWSGKGTETWTPNSNMLQLLVSIQGLILVPEPYFNEAGYERQKGSQQGQENSRMYNEMAVLKLIQSMTKLLSRPPQCFEKEVREHFRKNSDKFLSRLRLWHSLSMKLPSKDDDNVNPVQDQSSLRPEFPLIPASKGFCIALERAIDNFQAELNLSLTK